MGRSFESVRRGCKGCLGQMAEGQSGIKERGTGLWQRLAEIAKKHSGETFYALDDPLEALVFLVAS